MSHKENLDAILQKNKNEVSNGGHVIIRCAHCNKPLADIFRTRPNAQDPRTNKPFEWKFIAECCYCGRQSFMTTVLGGIHIGGYGINTQDGNEAYEKTTIETSLMQGRPDVTYIKTTRFSS